MLLLHSTIPAYCRDNLGSARYLHCSKALIRWVPDEIVTEQRLPQQIDTPHSCQSLLEPRWPRGGEGTKTKLLQSPAIANWGGSQFIFGKYSRAHAWLASNNGSSSQYVDASLGIRIPIVTSLVTEQNSVFCPNNNLARQLSFDLGH